MLPKLRSLLYDYEIEEVDNKIECLIKLPPSKTIHRFYLAKLAKYGLQSQ